MSSVASAQSTPPADGHDRGAFVIGLKAGVLFPEPFTEGRLGPSFLADIELGYVLPYAHRGFAVLLDAGYTQPMASGTTSDPRVGAMTPPASAMTTTAGNYTWSMTQRELVAGLTLMWRMSFIGNGRVAPYIGVGPRLWFLQTLVTGASGSNTISESREQSTRVGLSVPIGVDVGLGPGRIFIEAMMLWAPIDHRITGDSSVGSIDVLLGYRLWL
jgi:hypothetical protein